MPEPSQRLKEFSTYAFAEVDKAKDEVVVELLEAAVPIPITVKIDAIKVIRRDHVEEGDDPTSKFLDDD